MLITITLVTLFLGSENDHISNAFINIFWDLLWRHGTQRIQSRNIWAKIENPAPAPTEPINMKHFWGMFQSKFLELVWSLVLFMFLSLVVLLVHVFLSQCHPPCFLWESIMSSVYVPQSCPYLPPCLVSLFGPQFPRLVFYSLSPLSVMCIHVFSTVRHGSVSLTHSSSASPQSVWFPCLTFSHPVFSFSSPVSYSSQLCSPCVSFLPNHPRVFLLYEFPFAPRQVVCPLFIMLQIFPISRFRVLFILILSSQFSLLFSFILLPFCIS